MRGDLRAALAIPDGVSLRENDYSIETRRPRATLIGHYLFEIFIYT